MIAYVKGKLAATGLGWAVVDVNGMGYRLYVPTQPEPVSQGQEIKYFTHMAVREDGITLYGFLQEEELECFLSLLEVAGVGPKVALAVVSCLKPEALKAVIACGDVNQLVKVPGVGKKTAQRILLELKDKLKGPVAVAGTIEVINSPTGSEDEVLLALQTLGYGQNEARDALKKANDKHLGADVASLIKAALKELAPAR
ncbi:Holliday junction branch migration protein RuvA [Desulforamulus aquiferis]|uniref:Holliday junction branch migration complex subunit RuvA n=1 Tax=Desulforamulus aquiferis TaxID=1397668 RepID=A0AAW7ZHG0_9FIRM|nr:Holliday junction branch migration protein RuvA [Desulforamulus aquiferis]MDO7788866.1 Holliday junction branch migration protein RuvA [Desulforamulus aquiferis]RYD06405.1 hypothetical protein N752_04380 [Desulforamulus aquiferis]